ncbi:MAG: hypothetical protein ABSG61_06855 [Gemmatimonadales bacterium]|jgi:hypothetical protein
MSSARAGFLSALPDVGFAGVFLVTWIRPSTFGPFMVKWLLVVMLVEFIIIHSAAFMGVVSFAPGARVARGLRIVGLGTFYTLFAGAISFVFRSWWPITAFWGQTLNRLLGVILGQGQDLGQKAAVMAGWAASTVFYLLGCFATILLPIPRLGITPEVVAAQRIPGGGLWVEHPEKVIAFGVIYFGLTAWSELNAHRWAGKVKTAATSFAALAKPGSP